MGEQRVSVLQAHLRGVAQTSPAPVASLALTNRTPSAISTPAEMIQIFFENFKNSESRLITVNHG